MMQPNWFIQVTDKSLHGYYTLEVLLMDLALHRHEQVTVFELETRSYTTRYQVTTEAALRKQAEERVLETIRLGQNKDQDRERYGRETS